MTDRTQPIGSVKPPEAAGLEGPAVVIACRCMEPELEAHNPAGRGVEIAYLDQNLHRTPEAMPDLITEAIEKVEPYASRIVLGYGLCSNGIVGVRAPRQGLIVPRVHDCISLFLGSREAYLAAHNERAGTYYLTRGWLAEKKDPLGIIEFDYAPRVGLEQAEWAMREELKHYTHLVFINTGAGDPAPLRERALKNAEFLDKQYEEVSGTGHYFGKLLFGPYKDSDFVKVAPNEKVSMLPFLD